MPRNMLLKTICIVGLTLGSTYARSAEARLRTCDDPEVVGILRPLSVNKPQAGSFAYRYLYKKGIEYRGPVIVFLPGGPGMTSIAAADLIQRNFMPSAASAIFTDPRGRGCNSQAQDTDGYSTAAISDDILAIVSTLGSRPYILYGQSYGTILATVVASKAAALGHPPTALLLSGTVAHALGDDPYEGISTQWHSFRAKLDAAAREQLNGASLPFGASSTQWGGFLAGQLMTPASPNDPLSAVHYVDTLATNDGPPRASLAADVAGGDEPFPDEFLRVYKPIWCREIASFDNSDLALVNGELIGKQQPNFCDGYALTRPYNAADWPLQSPIFYLHGENDPLLPVAQAEEHYALQHGGKALLVVAKAGHEPEQLLSNCKEAFWNSILHHGAGLADSVQGCHWPINLRSEL